MKFRDEQEELDYLELRHLNTRAKRSVPKEEKKPEDKPEIHVHVAMPEIKEKVEEPKSPKKWIFKHRYDIHGRISETIATAE